MQTTKLTYFFPLKENGSISWNGSSIEYEEIEHLPSGYIKVKFLKEHLPSQNAPNIEVEIPEFFIIDKTNKRILNDDGKEIALTNMLKRHQGIGYETDTFRFQVRLLNNQCIELEGLVGNELPTTSGKKIVLANGCEQLIPENLEANYILLNNGQIILPSRSGGKTIGTLINNH
ncbi:MULTISPECIES: hypothetical protein [Acinetobacter]|uniref:hypothetical protein n=1 Tax=Acinetobacter TaxID=469 RepID=UPI0002AEC858|nr:MULTISPECIES: hypothetical protein [Acinetobacter]ELW77038.1 hypothetical protein ACINWC743_A0651 [Acinetobacter sp. WC-743]